MACACERAGRATGGFVDMTRYCIKLRFRRCRRIHHAVASDREPERVTEIEAHNVSQYAKCRLAAAAAVAAVAAFA